MMTEGLVKEAGRFRSGNVGVYAGDRLIHAGTSARYVPDLISQLMTWLKESKYHPLVKAVSSTMSLNSFIPLRMGADEPDGFGSR